MKFFELMCIITVLVMTIIMKIPTEYMLTTTDIIIETKWSEIEDNGMWGTTETFYFSDDMKCVYRIDTSKKVGDMLFNSDLYDDRPKVRFERIQEGESYFITYSVFLGKRLSKCELWYNDQSLKCIEGEA